MTISPKEMDQDDDYHPRNMVYSKVMCENCIQSRCLCRVRDIICKQTPQAADSAVRGTFVVIYNIYITYVRIVT